MKTSAEFLLRVQNILDKLGSSEQPLDELSRRILFQVADGQAASRPVTVSSVTANKTYGTPPTVYSRIKHLVEQGMIKTTPNPEDRRSVLLSITPKAKRQLEAVASMICDATPA